jgi:hypothetical protein
MIKIIEDAITEAKLLDMPRITLSLKDAEQLAARIGEDEHLKRLLQEDNELIKIANTELRSKNFSLNKWA